MEKFRAKKLVRRALRLIDQNTVNRAIPLFREAVESDPRDPRILLPAARGFQEAGLHKEAGTLLQDASTIQPQNPAPFLFLGILHYDEGNWEESLGSLDRCLEISPMNQLAGYYRAIALYRMGKKREALAFFQKNTLTSNVDFLVRFCCLFEKEYPVKGPSDPGIDQEPPPTPLNRRQKKRLLKSGLRAFEKRDYTSAATAFESVFRDHNQNINAAWGLALCLLESGRAGKAWQILLEILDANRDEPEPPLVACLGRAAVCMGEYDRGIAILQKVPLEGPDDYGVNYSLALGFLFLGKPRKASLYFERAFRYYYVDTWEYCLGSLLDRMGLIPSGVL